MMSHIFLFLSIMGLLSSTVYLVLVAEGARRFRRHARRERGVARSKLPAVTVFKPVHGLEPYLERNLESFFLQDYPDFELIFGARDADDAALKIVEDLRQKYPRIKTKVLLSGPPAYPNAKVFTLEKMIRQTSTDYLVITDSDVCVSPACLREVITPLLREENGLVTCLYTGLPAGGLWSQLEAMGMSVELASGVLVANMLEGMRFALGPIMAIRRDVLDAIGGFSAVADYHADDYKLGNLVYTLGKNVVLSTYICGHMALNTSVRMSFAHQTRWMRSTRFSRSAGHIGTGLTYAMPFALLGFAGGALAHEWQLAAGLLGWGLLNRMIQSVVVGWGIVGDRKSLKLCWLYPLRDLMGFLVWSGSFLGNEMLWRNERYRFVTDGKIVRL